MINNKTQKILISLIIIMLILITGILLVILKLNFNEIKKNIVDLSGQAKEDNSVESIWYEENKKNELKDLRNNNEYYTIKECIENYMYSVATGKSDNIYIDKYYINSKKTSKITENFLEGYTAYEPTKIQYISKDKVFIYIVEGYIAINEGLSAPKECNLIVKLDYSNYKYSIIPEIEELNEEEIFNNIEEKNYNQFTINSISNVKIATRYFENFIFLTINNIEESFNLIEQSYKEKKFNNNINDYKSYINNNLNYKNVIMPKVEECKVIIDDNYTFYIVTDSNKNRYVFTEISVNNISVMLDTETIQIEGL